MVKLIKQQKNIATATVKENRLVIFQPTERPTKEIEVVIKNAHGKVTITGKLGQVHKDLLDIVRYLAIDHKMIDGKRLAILFDPYKVRKTLAGGKHEYDFKKFKSLLDDLIQTLVSIKTPDFFEVGSFLYRYREANLEVRTKSGKTRKLAVLEFGELGTKLLLNDIKLFYNPEKIAKLRHGVSKAVARYILSQQQQPKGGWKIDTVIEMVAGKDISSKTKRDYKYRLKKEKTKLAQIGIVIKNDRILFDSKSVENHGSEETGVAHIPESVAHIPESVAHIPESVTHIPESDPF